MTVVIRRNLYYNYTITSQSYSSAKPISGSNGLNKPNTAAEPADAAADAAAEPADATTDVKCYTGGNASFYTTNYRQ